MSNLRSLGSKARYPAEEPSIVGQLVRIIAAAQTWQEITETASAIFHVQLHAKSMRGEQEAECAQERTS